MCIRDRYSTLQEFGKGKISISGSEKTKQQSGKPATGRRTGPVSYTHLQVVGMQALAAVGATGTISFLILGFMQGLTTGFTVLTSQRFGAGDTEGVKKSVGCGYVLAIIVTVLMTALSVAGMNWLLRLMQTPEDIYGMAYTYIIIICWGMGFNILYNLLSSMLRAVGNSKVPLYFLDVYKRQW